MKPLLTNLFNTIQSSELKKYPLLSFCMKDGVLFPEEYEKSPLKMAFILKEPYADWDEETDSPMDCDNNFLDKIRDFK